MNNRLKERIGKLLVCPVCKGELVTSRESMSCAACSLDFPQDSGEYFDLMPRSILQAEDTRWESNQLKMEKWYRDLLVQPPAAVDCFRRDYDLYRPILQSLSGLVLDVGGGNGIARTYLPDETTYVSLDPSVEWLTNDWAVLADHFRCLNAAPFFVRGVGEYLPFSSDTFDAVLSFWSLNHAIRPNAVLNEMHAVLRPGGRLVIVLEDMQPRWRDLQYLRYLLKHGGLSKAWSVVSLKLKCQFGRHEWPVQDDHILIDESEFHGGISNRFSLEGRGWIGPYLTFELRKRVASREGVHGGP